MSLSSRLVVRRNDFTLDIELAAAPGEVVALLGPNGAGKTTALRALAGLADLDDGHITLDDVRLDRVPTENRRIGVVFQDYLLFPHLSALDNVAFGPRCRRVPRRLARAQAAEWLTRVGLADHVRKKPRQLSWRGRSRPNPACCCSTNRWPPSTPAPAWRPAPSCAATSPRSPAPRFWSPTTRSTP
jgi:molybdate transport system ATP-binding protein